MGADIMEFDVKLAVARMDVQAGYGGLTNGTGFDILRDKYPELSFVFDELQDLRAEIDDSVSAEDYKEQQEECGDLSETLSDASDEFDRLADIAETITGLADPEDIRTGLKQIVSAAREAAIWCDK